MFCTGLTGHDDIFGACPIGRLSHEGFTKVLLMSTHHVPVETLQHCCFITPVDDMMPVTGSQATCTKSNCKEIC